MKYKSLKEYRVTRATNASLWVCHCGWEKCQSAHSYGPAVRDHMLLHYVVSGAGILKNQNGEFRVTKGKGFLISSGEVTTYTADKNDPWEYYWVGFKGVDSEHITNKCGISSKNPIFECEDTKTMKQLFFKLFSAFKEDKAREYTMLAHLYLILSELMDKNVVSVPPAANSRLYLSSAVAYINDNYSYDIGVNDLAAYIGIDRTYLYRIFMRDLDISPEQYILKVRMTKAANLLKSTELSVLQIALSTGYKDISHFSNLFKRFFGISPSIYRKS